MKFTFLSTLVLAVLIAVNPLESPKVAKTTIHKPVCNRNSKCIKKEKTVEGDVFIPFQITPFHI